MSVPNWYSLVLLGTAAWRSWYLLAEDDILHPLRLRLPGRTVDWLLCPFCAGFWIALGWWGAWQEWPHGTLVVAAAVTLTAIVPFLADLSPDDLSSDD